MMTFINVFTVHAGQQAAAFDRIQQIYTEVVQHHDGFIDATLLTSDDGTTVTAIAHWDDPARLQSLRQMPRFQDLHDQAFQDAIAKVEPHIYSTLVEIKAGSVESSTGAKH